jgi:hypothetical protein
MPTAPAKRTKSRPRPNERTEFDDIVVLGRDDDAQQFTARIFESDEVFVFSTDINAYLQLAAFSGRGDAFVEFMDSLVCVTSITDDDDQRMIDRKTREEAERFHSVLKETSGLGVERLAQFVADITEIAGQRPTNSSSD